MRWERRGTSDNIEDRRGAPQRGGGRGGRGAGLGIVGTLVVLAIAYFTGINPQTLMGAAEAVQGAGGGGGSAAPSGGTYQPQSPAEQEMVQFVSFVLDDNQAFWRRLFAQRGQQYQDAQLVLFTGQVASACGNASAASGPFYCPGDNKAYIDLSFYQELRTRFRAPGDFAQAYVLSHEIGHHVQTLLGTSRQVRAAQRRNRAQSNQLQVRMELQADCYAGLWARHAASQGRLEEGDIEEGLGAAAAVGDDRIQREATGRVHPESWTHGSSEMRMRWFMTGFRGGDFDQCDTFSAQQL